MIAETLVSAVGSRTTEKLPRLPSHHFAPAKTRCNRNGEHDPSHFGQRVK